MNLPLDVWRSIVSICKIRDITNLCSVDKSFYSLCCEKNLWSEKFKEKNLMMINNKINTVSQYINEYRRVSYSVYTTDCLLDMVIYNKHTVCNSICYFSHVFSIDDLKNILINDHPIFTKINEDNVSKKHIDITIRIGEEGLIYYSSLIDNRCYKIGLLTENYDNIKFIISLINKILYYHPSTILNDMDYLPIILTKNLSLGYLDSEDKKQLIEEKNIGMNVILNMKNYIFKK